MLSWGTLGKKYFHKSKIIALNSLIVNSGLKTFLLNLLFYLLFFKLNLLILFEEKYSKYIVFLHSQIQLFFRAYGELITRSSNDANNRLYMSVKQAS